MRRIARILCWMLLAALSASAGAEACFSREGAPYWHKDPECDFAGEEWPAGGLPRGEARRIKVSRAEAEGQKPCPGCATDWKPTFTGDFPPWPHAVAPWDLGTSQTWAPKKIRKKWGDPAERMEALCPERVDPETGETIDPDYPDDYAGIFVNAAGGHTLMIVNPTPERVETYRRRLKGEFWVLSARYGWEALRDAQRTADERLDWSAFRIASTGIDVTGNRLEIGVYGDLPENAVRIRSALAALGYDEEGLFAFVPATDPKLIEDF